ncbi:MAG TPA: efflux RND transporter periplasmic adaptor subunit [Gammaproteobacteria bacterium]|nr:efflux RND transporter periplasmic adaptor subunit [Gammaproteobacteria bacterium]
MTPKARTFRNLFIWLIVLGLIGGGVYYWRHRAGEPAAARFRTVTLDTGNIVKTVSANGTLNPVTLVNVGTQVSGTVRELNADFNDHVKKGQILAKLDPSLFEAQLKQDQAALASARSTLKLAEINARRNRDLFAKGYIAESDVDTTNQALADARAKVASAKAQIQRDRTNLSYTVIRSPVSGVVVSRNIDIGQTVAASFQTPTLFQIAQDLTHMQIDTSMAEADVGGVKVGQKVTFTVDAYPDRTFHGSVRQIRLNPTIQQNVVTYDVVVNVNNPEGVLLPGMTAYVTVVIDRRDNVLRVPNAALRFHPRGGAEALPNGQHPYARTLYRVENNKLVPVPVTIGIANNQYTEIVSGNLKAGNHVVVEDLGPAGNGKPPGHFRFRAF